MIVLKKRSVWANRIRAGLGSNGCVRSEAGKYNYLIKCKLDPVTEWSGERVTVPYKGEKDFLSVLLPL